MLNITIYQINLDRDEKNVAFLGYDRLERFQGSREINSGIYDKVYEGTIPGSSLEDVYTKFNLDHPADYRGRSLSVSDIVGVTNSSGVCDGFYFCDSIGFKAVAFAPEQAADRTSPAEKPRLEELMQAAEGKSSVAAAKNGAMSKESAVERG